MRCDIYRVCFPMILSRIIFPMLNRAGPIPQSAQKNLFGRRCCLRTFLMKPLTLILLKVIIIFFKTSLAITE